MIAPEADGANAELPRTLADQFAGRVGQIESGGQELLSENAEELFGEHLEAKRRSEPFVSYGSTT